MLTSTATPSRAIALDDALGDPTDPKNPAGFAGVLDADERGVFPAAAEAILDDFGVNAEFVPQALGGRLRSIDELARTLRPVFRRDMTLGVGYGISSFMAATNVWTAGSTEQQRALAATLLANEKASVCYHELHAETTSPAMSSAPTQLARCWCSTARSTSSTTLSMPLRWSSSPAPTPARAAVATPFCSCTGTCSMPDTSSTLRATALPA